VDQTLPNGEITTKQVKRCLGEMSERAAEREHARIMEAVNQQRGSIDIYSSGTKLRRSRGEVEGSHRA